jgi:hypothetical protein
MAWITTKLLAYVSGALLLCVIAVSTFAVYQHNVIKRVQAEAALAEQQLDTALAANTASTAMVKSLEVERDAFVLKRAMELKQAQAIVAQSQSEAAQALTLFLQAKERIRRLSRQADCRTVMAMPICPAIANELRVAP